MKAGADTVGGSSVGPGRIMKVAGIRAFVDPEAEPDAVGAAPPARGRAGATVPAAGAVPALG
jgi:hypothetical protein